ncbi:MAG TPA: sugar transferase [Candidatus Kapabacteria bacterium]|nr:sugar transferase [Candidatus Kapabacteria bacterium]
MNRKRELISLMLSDLVAINASWLLFYWMRVESGWFHLGGLKQVSTPELFTMSALVYGFWLVAFVFFGLYKSWYVRSPFDEIITVSKTLTVGTLFLTLFVWWDDSDAQFKNDPRVLAITYLATVWTLTVAGRILVRAIQHRLLEMGVGRRPSIVIGPPEKAQDLASRVEHYPRLGYEVIGFVTPYDPNRLAYDPQSLEITYRNGKLGKKQLMRLGTTAELETVINKHGVQEVLIALGSDEHSALLDVMNMAPTSNVGIKIVPDLYDIITGQVRTREIYGFPLIDINPVILRPWEEAAKRLLDIVVSLTLIVIGLPIWAITAVLIRLTSEGPAIYHQSRLGKDGKPFKMYKFRSMKVNADKDGPMWTSKVDPRITPFGRFIRRIHLDEAPQLINILIGDMSLVGPRPEQGEMVEQLAKEIPYYKRRLKVRPGITSLFAAMEYKYDENIEDVRNKVKYDLMYIESMSFRLDIKILFLTFLKRVVKGKEHA